jgi:hypothetical protein
MSGKFALFPFLGFERLALKRAICSHNLDHGTYYETMMYRGIVVSKSRKKVKRAKRSIFSSLFVSGLALAAGQAGRWHDLPFRYFCVTRDAG